MASTAETHTFITYFIASRKIDSELFQALPKSAQVAPYTCEVLPMPEGGRVFMFHFGAITFWNIPQDKIPEILRSIEGKVVAKSRLQIWDDYRVEVHDNAKPRVHFSSMTLDAMTTDRAEVIALILGQSAAMEYYENSTELIWRTLDDTIKTLKTSGKVSMRASHLPKTIGTALETRGQVARVLHMLDRPDLIWEDSIMDQLYDDLRASFDLPERFQALEYKLGLIQDSSQLLLDIAGERRLVWLESAIVIMIAFDILMTLYEKYA